jgi:hypothetical protein
MRSNDIHPSLTQCFNRIPSLDKWITKLMQIQRCQGVPQVLSLTVLGARLLKWVRPAKSFSRLK